MNRQQPPPVTMRFVSVAAVFVTALITANVIAVKLIMVGGVILPAAILIFPISYIVGDVLTEVYGYGRARQVIWLGFACNLVAVAAIWIGQVAPPAPGWAVDSSGVNAQAAYERILGMTPRILAASFAAYLVGEFANALTMARMKVATSGRHLWLRTIGSTFVGQGLDSLVFITLAFGFAPQIILNQWLAKTLYETLATPLTYRVVNHLKRVEGIDMYDTQLSANPFRWREDSA